MQEDIKYLPLEIVNEIINGITDIRDKTLFTLMFTLALRVSEATDLILSDIDFHNLEIKILPKKKERAFKVVMPLPESAAELLKQWLEIRPKSESDFVFLSKRIVDNMVVWEKISTTGVYKNFRKYCLKTKSFVEYEKDRGYAKKAGEHKLAHPHTLRHSWAVCMARNGFDISSASKHLRHSSTKSTAVYYDIEDSERKKRGREAFRMAGY